MKRHAIHIAERRSAEARSQSLALLVALTGLLLGAQLVAFAALVLR